MVDAAQATQVVPLVKNPDEVTQLLLHAAVNDAVHETQDVPDKKKFGRHEVATEETLQAANPAGQTVINPP